MKNTKKRTRILVVVGVILIVIAIYVILHLGQESTDDATIEAHIVSISPKVSGYIKAINVVDNQPVKAGDILMEIDTTDYVLKLDRAQANVDAAKARASASGYTLETTLISAPSNLEAVKAQVAAAEANWKKAKNNLTRMQNLDDESRSKQQLDDAVAAERTEHSNLLDAQARLRSAATAPKTIENAKSNAAELAAGVKLAEAELAQVEKDLNDTKIIAPMDGFVTKKGVEVGDYIQPGQTLGFLVGTELWVVANFKETQLKHMKKDQKVDIHVDAFPSADLEGKVESIQSGTGVRFSAFPPENATGNFVKIVQRVPVKITITNKPDGSLPLGPGMSVVPTVYTK